MGDAIISRRGGTTLTQALAPSIIDFGIVSPTSIKFKLRNNDALTATLVYRFSSLTGDGESISLATDTTSSEITLTGLTLPGTLFVTANTTGKIKSNVAEQLFVINYTAATGGTTAEYDDGGKRYKSHTFLEDGDFVVTTIGDNQDDRNKIDYLIIAGGGPGGGSTTPSTAAGGGAGGYRTTNGTSGGPNPTTESKVVVNAQSYSITVGAPSATAVNGNDSSAFGIVSIGGGRGSGNISPTTAGNGGSGGGRGFNASGPGLGTAGQGFNGGNPSQSASGGGGGAGQAGTNASNTIVGNGGVGLANTLRDGTSETRAVGGIGRASTLGANSFATANTGNGGSGMILFQEGVVPPRGGSGIVIIRYEIALSV